MNILDRIDTRQGTQNDYRMGHGNALPYTAVPFAMNHFVMQTCWQDVRYFHPMDYSSYGIRLTHQPSPWMGDFAYLVMNVMQLPEEDFSKLYEESDDFLDVNKSGFRPNEAQFRPHKLEFTRLRDQLKIKFIPTMYGGKLKVNVQSPFVNRKDGIPVLSLAFAKNGWYEISDDGMTITGYTNQLSGSKTQDFGQYFVIECNQPVHLWTETEFMNEDEWQRMLWMKIDQPIDYDHDFQMTLTTSYISVEQARFNKANDEFYHSDRAEELTAQKWLDYLNRIEVQHHDVSKVDTFYTCLYRTALFPQTSHEFDEKGHRIHFSAYTQAIEDGAYYTNNGYWDTFRTNYPLYSILIPEQIPLFIEGILAVYQEDGYLPKWLSPDERGMMPGTLVDGVIADAIVKELVDNTMAERLLKAMMDSATKESDYELEGREGLAYYQSLGYLPYDKVEESVNKTLDYAYSDFCIAMVARKLGYEDIYQTYIRQSLNYRHLFDPERQFMVPKDSNKHFMKEFIPYRWGDHYTEGSAWQNGLGVYHNVQDLIDLYGSDEAFYQHLQILVNQDPIYQAGGYGQEIHEMVEMAAYQFGQLALSNQPSFHIPYLFIYCGYPHVSQQLLKPLMETNFSTAYDGFIGDEDNGSLSSWFVLSSLGLYQMTPGTPEYLLGISIWNQAKIHMSNGKTLTIQSDAQASHLNVVYQRFVNQEEYQADYISYQDLMAGPTIYQRLGMIPSLDPKTSEFRPFSVKNRLAGEFYCK